MTPPTTPSSRRKLEDNPYLDKEYEKDPSGSAPNAPQGLSRWFMGCLAWTIFP